MKIVQAPRLLLKWHSVDSEIAANLLFHNINNERGGVNACCILLATGKWWKKTSALICQYDTLADFQFWCGCCFEGRWNSLVSFINSIGNEIVQRIRMNNSIGLMFAYTFRWHYYGVDFPLVIFLVFFLNYRISVRPSIRWPLVIYFLFICFVYLWNYFPFLRFKDNFITKKFSQNEIGHFFQAWKKFEPTHGYTVHMFRIGGMPIDILHHSFYKIKC